MDKHRKRTGYSFTVEDGEAVITVIRPLSGEFLRIKKYLVIYEDAHGMAELNFFNKSEITSIYGIKPEDLEDV
jgi:hypothetical protein